MGRHKQTSIPFKLSASLSIERRAECLQEHAVTQQFFLLSPSSLQNSWKQFLSLHAERRVPALSPWWARRTGVYWLEQVHKCANSLAHTDTWYIYVHAYTHTCSVSGWQQWELGSAGEGDSRCITSVFSSLQMLPESLVSAAARESKAEQSAHTDAHPHLHTLFFKHMQRRTHWERGWKCNKKNTVEAH